MIWHAALGAALPSCYPRSREAASGMQSYARQDTARERRGTGGPGIGLLDPCSGDMT